MSLADAIHELRERVSELGGWLSALASGIERAGGGSAHHLIDQVDKAVLEMVGWLNQIQSAIWRAARLGATTDDMLTALTEAQRALDQLRRKQARGLGSRGLAQHLADLYRRYRAAEADPDKSLGAWAGEAIPLIRAACWASKTVDAALTACWRELAGQPIE